MAPEVVMGQNYDARCDWWSVAIILYEVHNSHPSTSPTLIFNVSPGIEH